MKTQIFLLQMTGSQKGNYVYEQNIQK